MERANTDFYIPYMLRRNQSSTYKAEHNIEQENSFQSPDPINVSRNILMGSARVRTGGSKLLGNPKCNTSKLQLDRFPQIFKDFDNLKGLDETIKNNDFEKRAIIYYRAQHYHSLDDRDVPFELRIYILRDKINFRWIRYIEKAIDEINEAAPGLRLRLTENELQAKIKIGIDDEGTDSGYFTDVDKSFIHLGTAIPMNEIQHAVLHEMLHCLGFIHAMQGRSSEHSVHLTSSGRKSEQLRSPRAVNLTRFDPFSVLMYQESTQLSRNLQDPIWELKPDKEPSDHLSELDKVALNLLYKPCKTESYKPVLSPITGMLYCGRQVMTKHNQIKIAKQINDGLGGPRTDGKCGPENFANCHACRVIKAINTKPIIKLREILNANRWQGLSGIVYCGKRYTSGWYDHRYTEYGGILHRDGVCGPDNGLPCTECGLLLVPGYKWEDYLPVDSEIRDMLEMANTIQLLEKQYLSLMAKHQLVG